MEASINQRDTVPAAAFAGDFAPNYERPVNVSTTMLVKEPIMSIRVK